MPKISDQAIVLKAIPHKETDLIVHLLARERGRRNAFARSAKKSKKRFPGGIQPFSHIRCIMNVKRTTTLCNLDSAELISSYPEIQTDLTRIYMASYYCELLDKLLVEGECYPDIFELVLFFFNRLGKSTVSRKHRIFFELRLMELLGFQPDFQYCGESGKELGDAAFYDPQKSVFLAPDAARYRNDSFPVSGKMRLAMMTALNVPLDGLVAVRLSEAEAAMVSKITLALVQGHVIGDIKSLKLLDGENLG